MRNRKDVSESVRANKLITIVRSHNTEKAIRAAETLIEAGIKLIDIPMTVPGSKKILEHFADNEDVHIGAGAITTMTDVVDAINRNASFIVTPNTDNKIIDYCRDNDVFVAAGGLTPTELVQGYLAGVDLNLVYPVHMVGGPPYIKEVLTPMPFLCLMPVGGIGIEEMKQHLAYGAVAVGVTEYLIKPEFLANDDYDAIFEAATSFVNAVNQLEG